MRAFAVTVGRSGHDEVLRGPARIVETAKVALVCYPAAGLLILQSRRLRTGSVILDVADMSDAAWEVLRLFVASAEGGG